MKDFRIDPDASRELAEIFRYVACDNLRAAMHLQDKLETRFRLLAENPMMGQLRDELGNGLRSTSLGNYVIYFRPGLEVVEIVRVLHGARDVNAIFGQEDS